MIERESIIAKENHIVAEFVRLLEETVGDGVLSFSDIQEKKFMPFWQYFIIAEYIKKKHDFKIIFFGTAMRSAYENDYTGSYLSEMNFGKQEEAVRQLHLDVLNDNKRLYSHGCFDWFKQDNTNWYQIKVPLKRGDLVKETLTCVYYD